MMQDKIDENKYIKVKLLDLDFGGLQSCNLDCVAFTWRWGNPYTVRPDIQVTLSGDEVRVILNELYKKALEKLESGEGIILC